MKRYFDTEEGIRESTDYNLEDFLQDYWASRTFDSIDHCNLEDFSQDYNNNHTTVYPGTNGRYSASIPSLPDF